MILLCNMWRKRSERPNVGGVYRSRKMLRLESDAWSMVE